MSCRELVELVTEYLDGALGPADRARFEQHIGECDACDVYLDQFRRTIDAVGELREEHVPPHVANDLLRAFRAWVA